jgi:hypothetical protein
MSNFLNDFIIEKAFFFIFYIGMNEKLSILPMKFWRKNHCTLWHLYMTDGLITFLNIFCLL